MGAFHEGHLALIRAARAECETVVVSVFVNPAQFAAGEDFERYPRDEARDADARRGGRRRRPLRARRPRSSTRPASRPGSTSRSSARCSRATTGPATSAASRPSAASSSTSSGRERAYFGQKDAQQVAVVRRMVRDLNLERRDPRPPDRARRGRARPLVPQRLPLARGARGARSPSRGRSPPRDPERARALLNGLEVDYLEVADFEPRVLAAAVRVGKTRLIDNVVLEGDPA